MQSILNRKISSLVDVLDEIQTEFGSLSAGIQGSVDHRTSAVHADFEKAFKLIDEICENNEPRLDKDAIESLIEIADEGEHTVAKLRNNVVKLITNDYLDFLTDSVDHYNKPEALYSHFKAIITRYAPDYSDLENDDFKVFDDDQIEDFMNV